MGLIIKANGVILPSPTEIKATNEIIWSSNTGRSTTSGKMLGDVIAEKGTFSIKWEMLTKEEQKLIVTNMKSGFYPVSFVFDDETITLTTYRGTISSEMLGYIGDGKFYYKSVACDIIEQ